MQMNHVAESTRWVIAVLVLFGVWMAFILYVILSSPRKARNFSAGSRERATSKGAEARCKKKPDQTLLCEKARIGITTM